MTPPAAQLDALPLWEPGRRLFYTSLQLIAMPGIFSAFQGKSGIHQSDMRKRLGKVPDLPLPV
jgi:hypothetical protein